MYLRHFLVLTSLLLIVTLSGCGASRRYLSGIPVGTHHATKSTQCEHHATPSREAPSILVEPEELGPTPVEAPGAEVNALEFKPAHPAEAETARPLIQLNESRATVPPLTAITEGTLKAESPDETAKTSNNVVFTWEHGFGKNYVVTQKPNVAHLKPQGEARFDEDGAMILTNGAYVLEGIDNDLLNAATAKNELSIELVISPFKENQSGPARILTFSRDHNSRNFTVGQDRNNLVFRLRTSKNDKNGTSPELTITKLKEGTASHIIITYRDGLTHGYVNGELVFESNAVQGDFSTWEPHHVVFGDERNRQRNWSGKLIRASVSTDFKTASQAAELHTAWRQQ